MEVATERRGVTASLSGGVGLGAAAAWAGGAEEEGVGAAAAEAAPEDPAADGRAAEEDAEAGAVGDPSPTAAAKRAAKDFGAPLSSAAFRRGECTSGTL
jgi:hypothetical protein